MKVNQLIDKKIKTVTEGKLIGITYIKKISKGQFIIIGNKWWINTAIGSILEDIKSVINSNLLDILMNLMISSLSVRPILCGETKPDIIWNGFK